MANTQISPGMIAPAAVGTTELADGALAANTAGRAKMADGFVSQAKLGTGTYSTGGPAFSAYRNTSAQTVSSGVATRVALNAEDFDTDNAFDSTTNSRFQPTVAGYYQFNGRVTGSASGGGTITTCQLQKNGAMALFGSAYIPPSGSSSMTVVVSGLVYLNGTTDYLELYVTMTGSGTCSVSNGAGSTFLQGVLVRAG